MKWLILILGIACNASASVLIKLAMTPPRRLPSLSEPLAILNNFPLLLGIFLYGMAFLLYAATLAFLPLNVAHPVLTSGAIACVALMSVVLFKEPVYWSTIAGILMVIAGVVLITLKVK